MQIKCHPRQPDTIFETLIFSTHLNFFAHQRYRVVLCQVFRKFQTTSKNHRRSRRDFSKTIRQNETRARLGRRVLARNRRAWRIPNSDWQLINAARRHPRGQLARPRYRNAIFIAGARARASERFDTSTRCIGGDILPRHVESASHVVIDLGTLPAISPIAAFLRDVYLVSRFASFSLACDPCYYILPRVVVTSAERKFSNASVVACAVYDLYHDPLATASTYVAAFNEIDGSLEVL